MLTAELHQTVMKILRQEKDLMHIPNVGARTQPPTHTHTHTDSHKGGTHADNAERERERIMLCHLSLAASSDTQTEKSPEIKS